MILRKIVHFSRSLLCTILCLVVALSSSFPSYAENCVNRLKTQGTPKISEGDLVFINSTSRQSEMLAMGTRSKWTHVGVIVKNSQGKLMVFEASSKVTLTSLEAFLSKSGGSQWTLTRPDLKACQKAQEDDPKINCNFTDFTKKAASSIRKYSGKPYDTRFQMEDDNFEKGNEKIYCSELTQKLYAETFNLEIAKPQSFQKLLDLKENQSWTTLKNTDKHLLYETIVERYPPNGKTFNPMAPVISPLAQLQSPLFKTISSCEDNSVTESSKNGRQHE